MAPELQLAQVRCTTPAQDFYDAGGAAGGIAERTGVSTDDHGWERYAGTSELILTASGQAQEAASSTVVGWWLGYYLTNGQPSDGQYENVVRFTLETDPAGEKHEVRLYNDSGTYKFRLWNIATDAQVGSDSAGVTVGQAMLINVKADSSAETLTLYLDGSAIISATSVTMGSTVMGGMTAGTASTGTVRYWSAWCHYMSSSDDLNEAHYPEMRLIHPAGDGTDTEYDTGTWASWDDLASEGDPDGDTTWLAGPDGIKQETSTMTTHTMTNTIQGVAVLQVLRSDQASKTVLHGIKIYANSVGKVLSYGSEDIGESYVVREGVMYSKTGGSAFTQTDIDGMEAGHRREAGSDALNIRVTVMSVCVVALGTTNLAPPDPPAQVETIVGSAGNSVALGSANAMMV